LKNAESNAAKLKQIEDQLRIGLLQRKSLDFFKTNLRNLLVEKTSRQFIFKRTKLSNSQVFLGEII